MDNVIEARGLRKRFGTTTALDGLDLTVRAGEVHAFLGPDGAGKTTTIRILLGLMRTDGGQVTMLGGDPWADAARLHGRVAYVPGDVTLWPALTGGEIIDLLGRPHGDGIGARQPDPKRKRQLIEHFGLDPTVKARSYSKGSRQKVALIAAFASDAELLLLDEPAAGLDPLLEATFRDCVQAERRAGRTVLLASHILAEAEALADRVTIIRAGRTVQTGSLTQLRHLTRTTIEAELGARADLGYLRGVYNLTGRDLTGGGAWVRCEVDPAALPSVLDCLADADVRRLACRPPTLEELFRRQYTERAVVAAHP